MRHLLLIFLMAPFFTSAQEYVDLFKISYGRSFKNSFKGTHSNTDITHFKVGLSLPIALNEEHALITGADFGFNKLQFFPKAASTSMYSTMLKLGAASTWTPKWSTTFVLLPKIASDYQSISQKDFYLGAIALIKLKKNKNFKYRFGIYLSQEAFGLFTTPILGCYYLSPNKRFEIDASLPIAANINYDFGSIALGMDYLGIGRSFNIHQKNAPNLYVADSSLEFAAFLRSHLLDKSVMINAKIGYTTNDYQLYAQGDKVDLAVSALRIGDDRHRLNPKMQGSIFLRAEAIYRFHIK